MISLPLASAMQGLVGLYNVHAQGFGVNSNLDFLLSLLYHDQLLSSYSSSWFSRFFPPPLLRMVSHITHWVHCPRFKPYGKMLHNQIQMDGWGPSSSILHRDLVTLFARWNHGEESA